MPESVKSAHRAEGFKPSNAARTHQRRPSRASDDAPRPARRAPDARRRLRPTPTRRADATAAPRDAAARPGSTRPAPGPRPRPMGDSARRAGVAGGTLIGGAAQTLGGISGSGWRLPVAVLGMGACVFGSICVTMEVCGG